MGLDTNSDTEYHPSCEWITVIQSLVEDFSGVRSNVSLFQHDVFEEGTFVILYSLFCSRINLQPMEITQILLCRNTFLFVLFSLFFLF